MNGGRETQGIASGASIKTCPMKTVSKLEAVKGFARSSGQGRKGVSGRANTSVESYPRGEQHR